MMDKQEKEMVQVLEDFENFLEVVRKLDLRFKVIEKVGILFFDAWLLKNV